MQNVFWSALLQLISKRFFYSGYKRSRMYAPLDIRPSGFNPS